MKRRLLSLVLCALMILPLCLTGCNNIATILTDAKLSTITMYMVIEDGTTEQAIAVVQDAINEITENKYYTHVELMCYPEAEYEAVIDQKIMASYQEILDKKAEELAAKERAKALQKSGITTEAETTGEETTGEIETVIDKDGKIRPKYPDVEENQIDLFLIPSQAKYRKYALPQTENDETGLLYNMTEKVGDTFKLLNKYINPVFMNAMRLEDGQIFGMPSNHMVSEYTYLLLNKKACTEELSWKGDEFTNLTALLDYCKAVSTYCPDYVPLYNLPDPDIITLDGKFSVLGNFYVEGVTNETSSLPPKSLFANGNFTSHYKTCNKFKEAGYVEEGDAYTIPTDKQYAAAFLKGSVDIFDTYGEDYYIIPFSKPFASQKDLFSGVWCISNYSKNTDVCMRLVSMMSLDADFRNLLQYGVENETYIADEDTGMVIPKTEGELVWKVDPARMGNQFLLKQSSLMTERELLMSADNWAYAKQHNQNLQLSLYANFPLEYISEATIEERNKQAEAEGKLVDENGDPIEPDPYLFMYTQDVLNGIAALTEDVMKRVGEFEPYVDEDGNEITFDKFMNLIKAEVGANEFIVEATNTNNPDSILSQYETWYEGLYGEAG